MEVNGEHQNGGNLFNARKFLAGINHSGVGIQSI